MGETRTNQEEYIDKQRFEQEFDMCEELIMSEHMIKSDTQFMPSPKKPIKVRIFDVPNFSLKSSENISRAVPTLNQISTNQILLGAGGHHSTMFSNPPQVTSPNFQNEGDYPRRLTSEVYKSMP